MTNRTKDYVTKVEQKSTKQIPLFDIDENDKLIPYQK
jgi:hypothetical protein